MYNVFLFVVYTIYAACEYVIVLSNIAFHATDAMNFGEGKLTYSTAVPAKSKPS